MEVNKYEVPENEKRDKAVEVQADCIFPAVCNGCGTARDQCTGAGYEKSHTIVDQLVAINADC